MIDAEGRTARAANLPTGIGHANRKPEQLERVTVRVAELERSDAARVGRQLLRPVTADRDRRVYFEPPPGRLHVVGDDGRVVETRIRRGGLGRHVLGIVGNDQIDVPLSELQSSRAVGDGSKTAGGSKPSARR